LESALKELDLKAEIKDILVKDQEEANKLKFLGSTSIRINGKDISPFETDQYLMN